ncbi:Uncharacterised protein [Vibrio cholerae]|nr:Uncharacterised protein [Vibrio cholerae]
MAKSTPTLNSSTTEACPSDAVAVISFTPSIERISCSRGRTINLSASLGEIPWWLTET